VVVMGSCPNPVSIPTHIRCPLTASSVVSDLVTSKALLSCQTRLTLSSSLPSVSRRISDVLWRVEVGMTNPPGLCRDSCNPRRWKKRKVASVVE
jgi:hypothetical protein